MERRKEIPAGSATALLVELDSTVAEGRKGEILAAVAFALDAVYRVMGSAPRPPAGNGAQALAMSHLATRSMSDLVARLISRVTPTCSRPTRSSGLF
jgi:hypothetical protein